MKRGIVFSKYGTLAAATRQRFEQAMPYLQAEGIQIELSPLLDNDYLAGLFTKGVRYKLAVVKAYLRRLVALFRARRYDFVWVHCELFPYLPLERLVAITGKPVIFDYDDAIFHQYDQHRNPLVRALLGRKLKPLLERADIAFCGNAYLQAYAAQYCARSVVIPTTVDVAVYGAVDAHDRPSPPVLGWIGSPSTWPYCRAITPLLSQFVEQQRVLVLVVGANHAADAALPFTYRAWEAAREIADIQAMDIGMMPIPDAPWARGKCGYKLIQYMACGLPVIASPVGVNREIVQHGVNGFLADSEEEWQQAIMALAGDAALRARMGAEGRRVVEARYSIQRYGPEMARYILELC